MLTACRIPPILTPSSSSTSHFSPSITTTRVTLSSSSSSSSSKSHSKLPLFARFTRSCSSSSSNNGHSDHSTAPASPEIDEVESESSSDFGDSYVALFVRMLGLDHDPLDREQAIITLWQYSLGGKKYIDNIMQFPGCINLVVNLLRAESSSACEAAAGLLQSLSSIDQYRNSVADSGAIEEINRLLTQSSLASEVKVQSLNMLWNLSVDEKLRVKIAKSDLLLLAMKYLDDEDMKVKEAAGGILANLALSHVNHDMMVEAGVIPKLAKFLPYESEVSRVIRKEARNALLELVKDDYYRILVIEEGLVPVPLIGAAAYKSYNPRSYEAPAFPDGTEIERTYDKPSRFGAAELLIGLNVDNNANVDEAKVNAIIGQTQQQFLVRVGAIEMEETSTRSECSDDQPRLTLLHWIDGVARLVLILELEDKSAIVRAAESIASACINEHMRIAFKEAGAVRHLVRLLSWNDNAVQLAATQALEKLSASNVVCRVIETEGGLAPLVSILKCSDVAGAIAEKSLNVLAQILDPNKEMQLKFNGSKKAFDGADDGSKELSSTEQAVSKTNPRSDILNSVFTARLVEILKSFLPSLQEKAASVLEFVALIDPTLSPIISVDIEIAETKFDVEDQFSAAYAIELEEAGLAISAASRLLTRLLDSKQFREKINVSHFIDTLRKILKTHIPLRSKDWVAACLVKLSSLSGYDTSTNPINVDVTLYDTIPRLVEQIKTSFSLEAREKAVVELSRIVSEGVVDSTEHIISEGAVYSLVKLIEEGNERGIEASLKILYNLSMDSENHSALLAAGAVPALRRIVLSEKPQWQRALHLLRSLET
ncbi:armadillo/beta-catenin-like repeat protein, putative [Medicago truncatula]|uniref:Armadillo/beta-catenin-like repeat protein, putative n=1 Tax=Medicago truncatula TaxID=3880 RepID=G7IA05_MEDTR|nr:armadillo/beta-catenin-like repeat protein, putative [Medicago truncatula]